MPLRIGVDVGGVLSSKASDYEHDGVNRMGKGFDMPGWEEAIKALRSGGHQLFIVSFCGAKRAHETLQLYEQNYKHLFDGAYFVKDRAFKHDIALHLGLDVMIDDRLDVLQKMPTVYWIHFTQELKKPVSRNRKALVADSWPEAVQIVTKLNPRGNKATPAELKRFCHAYI